MSIEERKCERCGKNKLMLSWDTLCWECQQYVELENIKTKIQEVKDNKKVDTGSSDYIICPYCGEAFNACDMRVDYDETYIDGEHLLECPDCGEEFVLNTSVTYYYETYKKDKKEYKNV